MKPYPKNMWSKDAHERTIQTPWGEERVWIRVMTQEAMKQHGLTGEPLLHPKEFRYCLARDAYGMLRDNLDALTCQMIYSMLQIYEIEHEQQFGENHKIIEKICSGGNEKPKKEDIDAILPKLKHLIFLEQLKADREMMTQEICDALEHEIKPLAPEYDVQIDRIESEVIFLKTSGICHNCPSSKLKLQQIVEPKLIELFPEYEYMSFEII